MKTKTVVLSKGIPILVLNSSSKKEYAKNFKPTEDDILSYLVKVGLSPNDIINPILSANNIKNYSKYLYAKLERGKNFSLGDYIFMDVPNV